MFIQQLKIFLIGFIGLTGSIASPEVTEAVPTDYTEIVNLIVQIVIGVATLYKLFQNKFRDNNNSNL